MSKKKILYVITKGNWGGAQRYVYDLSTAFKDSYDITVALGAGEVLEKKLTAQGVRTIKIERLGRDIRTTDDVRVFFALVSLFRKEKPDVVHLNSSKIGGLGALAARFAGVKNIIFTVHGFAFNEDRSAIEKLMIRFASWLTIFLSTQTIFISPAERDQAKQWPFIGKKCVLIYNGISETSCAARAEARDELCRINPLLTEAFSLKTVIGTISELTKNKGLTYAIEAVAEMPDTSLIIIGEGEERAALEKKIRELDLVG